MKSKTLSSTINSSDQGDGFRPQLTSLIDVMTILLVFLIQNFSVEGNLITPSQDLTLPVSTVKTRPEMMISVQISENSVMVDGTPVVSVSSFSSSEEYMITELFEKMSEQKELATSSKMMLEVDREIPFNVVKRVAFTCSKAGFEDFSVLVYQEEK